MKGSRLLLVEDNEDLAQLWENYFGSAGFAVTVCEDGACALDKFSTEQFDLIASDYVLPDITGTQFLDKVREVNREIPFVLLTGMRERAIVDHVNRAGNALVVFKPISFKDLLAQIQELLARQVKTS